MLSKLKWLNLTLWGVLEAGIIFVLGYWGFKEGDTISMKLLLGIGAPLLGFGFWGLEDFRNAGRSSELLRLFQELSISGVAAVAWYTAGQHLLGWTVGLISVVHPILVYQTGETLLKSE